MADEVSDDLDPRAQIHHADGTEELVPRQDIRGLDEWIKNWPQNPQLPSAITLSGWQMADEDHPDTGCAPGYRIVYKTIRTVFAPALRLDAGNLLVRCDNGEITWGETRFPDALAHRREGEWVVPQWGKVTWQGSQGTYTAEPDRQVAFDAHQENTPPANFVEILYQLPEGENLDWAEKLELGRRRIAPLTAAMDLLWGERVLGPIITEEVGTIFDDWHWNRLLGGPTVAWEGQATVGVVSASDLRDALDVAFTTNRKYSEPERERLRIAAQWYWRADREQDRVMKFLSYWLCVEAVALEDGGHKIGPVKTMVAAILDTAENAIGGIGRIYNVRGKIAHGHSRAVTGEALAGAKAIAEALLSRRLLGCVSRQRVAALRDCAIHT